MTFLEAGLLGVIEGLTEFLPVSSTAHLLLATSFLEIPETEFVKSFVIAIQLGAILAVALLYWRRLLIDWETMKRVAVAFVPTAIIGFALYRVITRVLFAHDGVSVAMLLVFGMFLIIFERTHAPKNRHEDVAKIPYRTAFLIGCAQALAVVPGVSRAGATVVGGLLLGVTRSAIVEFSFILAVPTMLAATGYDLVKSAGSFGRADFGILAIGFAASFAAAILAVKFLLSYISNHSFEAFGWYRVAVATLAALLLLL